MRIGIDFDNTIADYDRVFPMAAVEMGLLSGSAANSKAAVRAILRNRDGGEIDWQRLQGQVYGQYMSNAELIEGVGAFLLTAKASGSNVQIVSHKTKYGHFDTAEIDLHEAARSWMSTSGFFEANRFGISPDAISFLPTRAEKVNRILQLNLDVFIDDLPEVFSEPGFPSATRKLLFTNGKSIPKGPFEQISDWTGLEKTLFCRRI